MDTIDPAATLCARLRLALDNAADKCIMLQRTNLLSNLQAQPDRTQHVQGIH
jgi:hypothetical protein